MLGTGGLVVLLAAGGDAPARRVAAELKGDRRFWGVALETQEQAFAASTPPLTRSSLAVSRVGHGSTLPVTLGVKTFHTAQR